MTLRIIANQSESSAQKQEFNIYYSYYIRQYIQKNRFFSFFLFLSEWLADVTADLNPFIMNY